MTVANTTTWILGLDLGDRSRGAACLAHWLAGPEHIVAVHVIELWSRPYIRSDVNAAVHEVVKRLAKELHIAPPARVSVIDAETAEEGLCKVSAGKAGLILGRAARHDEETPFALGRVARRVLRALPCPVVVVPPDLTTIAPGPVILATDLDTSSLAAIDFAREVAAKYGRELLVAHVAETRNSDLIDDLEPLWQRAREAYTAELAETVHRWMAEHALIGKPRIMHGSVPDELHDLAVATDAAMIVTGSRRLGVVGRVFLGSTASALAGRAACPVAVVA